MMCGHCKSSDAVALEWQCLELELSAHFGVLPRHGAALPMTSGSLVIAARCCAITARAGSRSQVAPRSHSGRLQEPGPVMSSRLGRRIRRCALMEPAGLRFLILVKQVAGCWPRFLEEECGAPDARASLRASMAASGRWCSGPLIHLYAVWQQGPSSFFASGDGGALYQWNGVYWVDTFSVSPYTIRAATGDGKSSATIVGDNGTIRTWNGTIWGRRGCVRPRPTCGRSGREVALPSHAQ